tara:strand:+ start:359 stop:517 length:159 start_codon:yes stop_codon:yes gene_type:complete
MTENVSGMFLNSKKNCRNPFTIFMIGIDAPRKYFRHIIRVLMTKASGDGLKC